MLTGKMPFNDDSPLGLMLEVVKAEIPDVRSLNHDADPQIAAILARMIAKDPNDRYQNCHDLVADLNQHPLVARGGPITVQTKLSPAAATLIGQKTPVSGQVPLPQTPRTPMPSLGAQANTHVTTSGRPTPPPVIGAAAHQSVLDRPTAMHGQASKRSPLPWAIAAIALLAIAGGAYAMRGSVPALASLFGQPVAQTADVASSVTPSAPVQSRESSSAASQAAGAAATSPASGGNAGVAATSATATTATLPDTTAPSNESAVASNANGAIATAQVGNETLVAQAPDPAATMPANDAGAPDARASQAGVEALRDLPAAKAAADAAAGTQPQAAQEVAIATPPPRPAAPAKPRVPTIAVMSSGDDVISSPAEDALVDLLQRRGFRVIEGGRGHGDTPNLRSLAGKADAVVFVHARPVGSQQLNYYGQSSTMYTVQLGVRAYRVSDGSVLWRSGGDQVNFTSLNAAEKAREAIEPLLDNIDGRLAEFRSRGRRG